MKTNGKKIIIRYNKKEVHKCCERERDREVGSREVRSGDGAKKEEERKRERERERLSKFFFHFVPNIFDLTERKC